MGLALGVSEFRGQEQYQVGATNSGLEEAGHGPLFSLLSITLCLLLAGIEDDPEALMVMEILGVLVERAGQEFEAASLRVAQLEEDYLAAMNRGPSSLMVFHGRRRLELMAGKLARRAREARSVGAWWLRDLRIRQHRRARDTKVDESSQPGRAQD